MQSVFRSTMVGLLTLAGLAACGDSSTTPLTTTTTPVATGIVHSVTVSPASLTLNPGATATLAASVDADANVDRTVTWSSGNTAVATVDANGAVKAVTAGTTTIIASSKANPAVQGAASVTVSGGTVGAPVTVSISSLNQTVCGVGGCSSVPANLAGVAGQLDVVLNVDAGGQPLKSVSATLKCGNDSVTQTQTITSGNVAASASAAPVTLSFNTAAFSPAGVAKLHNGQCTVSASAATTNGTQSAVSTQSFTLANADFISVATLSTTPSAGQVASAIGADGLAWKAGSVTVTATPVFYTPGRTASNVAVSLVNAGSNPADRGPGNTPLAAGGVVATSSNVTAASPGVYTVTFPNDATFAAANSVNGVTVDTLGAIVSTIDNSGSTGPAAVIATAKTNSIRLDNLAPPVAGIAANFNTQNAANGFIGPNFVFTTKAGSIVYPGTNTTGPGCVQTDPTCDYGGVDKVTFTTQYAVGSSSTFTTFTSPSSIPETSTGTAYNLRLAVCDALGNCANTASLGTFGVDLTPPVVNAGATSTVANNSIFGIGQTPPNTFSISATDPQGTSGSTGSGFSSTPVLVSATVLQPSGSSGQVSVCVIGTPSTADANGNTTCKAPAVLPLSFNVPTGNGQYQLTYQVVDQAGNTSPATTVNWYVDQSAPAVAGGLAIPSSITTGSTFSATATDNMDVASANGFLSYPIGIAATGSTTRTRVGQPASVSPVGVPFDNVLTRSATATTTLAQFYRSLGTVSGGVITAGVKPDSVGIRALDAANNLGVPDEAALPATNISAASSAPYVIGRDLNDFQIGADQATLSNGSGTGPRSTNLIATVVAPNQTATTPFSQVCFYIVSPSGAENGRANPITANSVGGLSLLGCQSGASTTTVGSSRAFQYTLAFTPSAAYGTSGSLQFVAIGSNGNTDALATFGPATVGLQP